MKRAQATINKNNHYSALEGRGEPSAPIRPLPLPKSMHPLRKSGKEQRLGYNIRKAVEAACSPGACHGEGLAGWLIERAQGNLGDRQIFAGMVQRVMPAYLHTTGATGRVTINLGFAAGRTVGGLLIADNGTNGSQLVDASVQTIDMIRDIGGDLLIEDQAVGAAARQKDPPTPPKTAGRGAGER